MPVGQLANLEWAEPLPPECPPTDACSPNNEEFFRLVKSISPEETDFYSLRKLHPDKKYNTDECTARACSVFRKYEACEKVRMMPTHKTEMIVRIVLTPGSGVIKKTLRGPHHFSWWRAKGFDPVSRCQVVSSPSE